MDMDDVSDTPLFGDTAGERSKDICVGSGRRPPHNGTDTSIQAAHEIEPVSGRLRQRVYGYLGLMDGHGATNEELQDALGLAGSTVRPRVNELMNGGWVVDSGRRRPTNSGRMAKVWVVKGRELEL